MSSHPRADYHHDVSQPTIVAYSRAYPLPVEQTFDTVLPMPLEKMFDRRHGPIPAVRGTDRAQRSWDTVGDARTIRLADRGSLHEELTRVERPHAFGYRLSEIRGPMRPLASAIDGLWTFEAAGTGTRVTWSWAMHPKSALSGPMLPIFVRIWRGWARNAFDRIEQLLPIG
jgi:hypothetical protein